MLLLLFLLLLLLLLLLSKDASVPRLFTALSFAASFSYFLAVSFRTELDVSARSRRGFSSSVEAFHSLFSMFLLSHLSLVLAHVGVRNLRKCSLLVMSFPPRCDLCRNRRCRWWSRLSLKQILTVCDSHYSLASFPRRVVALALTGYRRRWDCAGTSTWTDDAVWWCKRQNL